MEAQYNIKDIPVGRINYKVLLGILQRDSRVEFLLESKLDDMSYLIPSTGAALVIYSQRGRMLSEARRIFTPFKIIGKKESIEPTKKILEEILGFRLKLKMELSREEKD